MVKVPFGKLSSPLPAALIMVLLTLALRLFSIFPTVLDHDESTYIVIADALLNGATYQVDYIDTKPVGIFLIYAALQALFGSSIPGLRLAAAAVVAATAWVLYGAVARATRRRVAGLAAGLAYIVLTSTFTHWGGAPNTEIFFNLFTVSAVWLVLTPPRALTSLVAGLCLGVGFLIKQVVAFDALAIGLFLTWRTSRGPGGAPGVLSHGLSFVAGMVFPWLVSAALYHRTGHLADYAFLSFTVPTRYPSGSEPLHYVRFSADFFLRFLPITALYAVAVLNRSLPSGARLLGCLWGAAALAAVLLPGRYFEHYFVQFMPPFAFLAGSFYAIPLDRLPGWARWLRRPFHAFGLLGLVAAIAVGLKWKDLGTRTDYPRMIAEHLVPRLEPRDRLYVQEPVIVYHLLDRLPPNRYVHPTLLVERRHLEAMEIDVGAEVGRITSARPRFVILDPAVTGKRLLELTESSYRIIEALPGGISIFERTEPPVARVDADPK